MSESAPAASLGKLTSKKVAGVPVLYIAGLFGIVILYMAIKSKASPTSAADTPTGDTTPTITGDAGDTGQPVFQATPTIIQPSGPNSSVSSVPGPDTDELWKRRAITWLTANGYTLDVATSAISGYLNGDPLTTEQAKAKDAAVTQFGLPPETVPDPGGVISTPTTPQAVKPASKQGTAPTTHTVMGTSDDSFSELANLYYGFSGNGTGTINELAAYNPGVPRTGIPKGTKVHIPALVQPKYYRATAATRTVYQIASKNGTTPQRVYALNPNVKWPAKVGESVRVR